MEKDKITYFDKIDGLRFVAIALVLLEHFARFMVQRASIGYFAVDFFFVISGFLITNILINKSSTSFKEAYINFLGRRTLRVFPIYYLTILLFWVLKMPDAREYIGYLLTYTYNYAWIKHSIPNSPINHFWSLAVEEQFYLFWPFVIIPLRNRKIALIAVVSICIGFGYTQMSLNVIPSLSKYNHVIIFTRMASLAMGAFGAIWAKYYTLPKAFFTSKKVEITVFLILIVALFSNNTVKYPVLGTISLFLLIKSAYFNFSNSRIEHFLKHKTVRYIGVISYGIYIFHLPIAYYVSMYVFDPLWNNFDFSIFGRLENVRSHPWVASFPLFTVLSVLAAHLSYKYIETPILSLKDRLFKYKEPNK